MDRVWKRLVASFDRMFPEGTPRRKLLQIVAIVLLFEGISVMVLFSKAGLIAGIISLILGFFLLALGYKWKPSVAAGVAPSAKTDPPGIKLVDALMDFIGNDYIVMAIGAIIVGGVIVFNRMFSDRPDFGDLDTLTIMFGALILIFPIIEPKFKTEAIFALLFLGLVVLFLVVPQAVTAFRSGAGSSIGNWYVDYMLAAPFAGLLDLMNIPSSSNGSIVTITFQDGTVQSLGISAYCAGLYSFSIFLAAFCSFVLVFERLKPKMLVSVLALGLAIAFLGNLFRMVVIGVVGYYRGLEALLWAHENVGWIIFLSWSAVFWYLLLRYISNHPSTEPVRTDANEAN
jgi:archaeosortase C (PEF-CTERM variant)